MKLSFGSVRDRSVSVAGIAVHRLPAGHAQPASGYGPLAATSFFGDQRMARPEIEGTVARGHLRIDQTPRYRQSQRSEDRLLPFLSITPRGSGARWQERFNIYCTTCHIGRGDGNGMVVRRGFQQAASYHAQRLIDAPVGHFFFVISNGFGAMRRAAGSRIEPDDRWRIAAYIRVLSPSQERRRSTRCPAINAVNSTRSDNAAGC